MTEYKLPIQIFYSDVSVDECWIAQIEKQNLSASGDTLDECIRSLASLLNTMAHNQGAMQSMLDGTRRFAGCFRRPSKLPFEETISDGFGNTSSAICPTCGERSMEVVRPGREQCLLCG